MTMLKAQMWLTHQDSFQYIALWHLFVLDLENSTPLNACVDGRRVVMLYSGYMRNIHLKEFGLIMFASSYFFWRVPQNDDSLESCETQHNATCHYVHLQRPAQPAA